MPEETPVQAKFALQRIYTKDVSFESPAGPIIFTKAWKPKIQVDLNTRSKAIAENCPNMLFPYLREAVDALVVKGGFPALALQPVNFEALYRQAEEAAAAKAAEAASTTH